MFATLCAEDRKKGANEASKGSTEWSGNDEGATEGAGVERTEGWSQLGVLGKLFRGEDGGMERQKAGGVGSPAWSSQHDEKENQREGAMWLLARCRGFRKECGKALPLSSCCLSDSDVARDSGKDAGRELSAFATSQTVDTSAETGDKTGSKEAKQGEGSTPPKPAVPTLPLALTPARSKSDQDEPLSERSFGEDIAILPPTMPQERGSRLRDKHRRIIEGLRAQRAASTPRGDSSGMEGGSVLDLYSCPEEEEGGGGVREGASERREEAVERESEAAEQDRGRETVSVEGAMQSRARPASREEEVETRAGVRGRVREGGTETEEEGWMGGSEGREGESGREAAAGGVGAEERGTQREAGKVKEEKRRLDAQRLGALTSQPLSSSLHQIARELSPMLLSTPRQPLSHASGLLFLKQIRALRSRWISVWFTVEYEGVSILSNRPAVDQEPPTVIFAMELSRVEIVTEGKGLGQLDRHQRYPFRVVCSSTKQSFLLAIADQGQWEQWKETFAAVRRR